MSVTDAPLGSAGIEPVPVGTGALESVPHGAGALESVSHGAGGARRWRSLPLMASRTGILPVLSVIALTVFCTFAPAVLVAIDAARRGAVFLGVTGVWPMDQLQYLSWINDASVHGLVRNLYGLGGGAVFVHPLFTPLGLLRGALGLSLPATLFLAQALGLLVLLAGAIRLIWRRLGSQLPSRRAVALLLCVFGGLTPLTAVLPLMDPFQYTTHYNDAAGAFLSITALWAYAPLAIATGLMPFVIDDVERLIAGAADRRLVVRIACLGLLISWLHPWQGEELLIIAVGLSIWQRYADDGWRGHHRKRFTLRVAWRMPDAVTRAHLARLGIFGLATVAPVFYYVALSHFDVGWRTSARDSVGASVIPFPVLATCIAPLLLFMLLAVRRIEVDRSARVLVLWPFSCLLTIIVTPNGQYRALAGLALPLAVLAVRAWPARGNGWRRWLAGTLATAVALSGAVPFVVNTLVNQNGPNIPQYTQLDRSDVRAAAFAAAHASGRPIVAPVALGTAIPALTDAWVWAGHPIWTPDHLQRGQRLQELYSGILTAPQARAFVSSTGTRVVVQACSSPTDLAASLAPLGFRTTRLGCAAVYTKNS